MEKLNATGYLAPEDLVVPMLEELGKPLETHERLVLVKGIAKPCAWAQNIWLAPYRFEFSSIADAAKQLRAVQRNWALYSSQLHRRAKLIQEQLPHVSAKPIEFPGKLPSSPLGSWTLIAPNTILCSAECSSPVPNGELRFVENRSDPPSRAYLKLWEALTLCGRYPQAGERCLDAGASPGGWTWVLAQLGAEVWSVDRSTLAPELMRNTRVHFQKGDAFSILPSGEQTFDWVFSDVICYPEKLLEWIELWLRQEQPPNMICTLKFQGEKPYGVIKRFRNIPGGRVLHLFHNKHELTWIYVR
ncbi:MAG: SAM-dependent methyltransferase [Bdellovibrionota bacterium]